MELGEFSELVTESETMGKPWDMVLIACLAGSNNEAPSAKDIDKALKMMVDTVVNGEDLSRFLIFDRSGNSLQFGSVH